ncbi:MAG: PTS system mannose/fructose/N-acetylgalactosamine-transporter subunit IIB [Bulleidia sp.]
MIKLIRLDERLIHGQIAIKWSRCMGVDRIMVANDAAAANETVRRSLMMAAPPTAKTAIKSIAETLRMLQNPKAQEHNILLLVNKPADLLLVLDGLRGQKIEMVNIGNYGRIAPKKDGEARKTYATNLYLYPQEADELRKVKTEFGYDAVYRTTPEDPAEEIGKLLDK